MKIYNYEELGVKKSWNYEDNESPEDDGFKPLIDTKQEVHIMDVLIIDGIAYSLCALRDKKNISWGLAEKLVNQNVYVLNEEAEDQDFKNDLTCPFCFHEEGDAWELPDEEDDHECPNCGSEFSYQRVITVEYNSQPVKKIDGILLT